MSDTPPTTIEIRTVVEDLRRAISRYEVWDDYVREVRPTRADREGRLGALRRLQGSAHAVSLLLSRVSELQ